MSARRGTMLVELTLTLSACVVILTMSASLIHRALHTHSRSRLFFDVERSAMRLSESFRRDVHAASLAATGAETGSDDVLLRLQLPGGQTVEYRQAAGRVERLWQVKGDIQSREAFVFPPETRLAAQNETPRLVVLSLAPPAALSQPTERPLSTYSVPVSLQVEAILGRNASLIKISSLPEATP